MRLTVYSDYSLRLLMYLAIKEGELATIAEVAERYGISRNHLMKVAHQLGVAGYVTTVRGKGGGLRLARPAASIGLGEVVRQTEPDLALVPCFAPLDATCAIWPGCVLREAMHKALRAFLDTLDGYTLADLAKPGERLRGLLALPVSEGAPRPAVPSARSA